MNRRARFPALLGAAIALAASVAGPCLGEDGGRDDWTFQITPYVWASGISGRLTSFSGGQTIEFEESFSEVLENLDVAFFVSASARRDRLVFVGDLTFAQTSKDGLVPPGVPASGKLRQASLTLLAGYSVARTDDVTVDLMGGLRAWSLKSEVSVPAAGIQASPSKSFADPILAVRGTFAIAPDWSLSLYGDYGGFGVGSDETWQLVAAASYELRDNVFLTAGYRHLSVDYSEGGTRVDAQQSGPIMGVTWRF